VNEVGNLSFSDTASRLQEYPFYIGNDTGLSHLATLVAEKVLIIYGGGTFRRFFPWQTAINQHIIYKGLDCFDCNWICKHAERYCLTSIGSKDVVEFFDEIVAGIAPLERDLNSKNETYIPAWQILNAVMSVSVRPQRD
jgi:ADP-heptose:LPS heptosyltransferase